MRNLLHKICVLVLLLPPMPLGAQQSAAEYYSIFKGVFSDIQEKSWDYTRSSAHGRSTARIEHYRKQVVESIQNGIAVIQELPAFDGNSALRDSALRFLRMHYAVTNEDYARLVNMEKIAERSYDAMEAYVHAREMADASAKKAGEMFNTEFSAFASAYGITSEGQKSAIELKLGISEKVYAYYNGLYRIFFTSYKQEAYLIEAMQKNDVSGLEQNRNALARVSVQGIEELLGVAPFEQDGSLKRSLEKVLHFYRDEAEDKLRDISIFFVANDNFQKIILSYNNSGAAEHSVEESMLFNKALTEHKAATENYRKLSMQLDKERARVLEEWHEACDRFIKRNIPKS